MIAGICYVNNAGRRECGKGRRNKQGWDGGWMGGWMDGWMVEGEGNGEKVGLDGLPLFCFVPFRSGTRPVWFGGGRTS